MTEIIDAATLVRRIVASLHREVAKPGHHAFAPELVRADRPLFTLVVGAGFSAGVVPMVNALMREHIGAYYLPDQDMSAMERPSHVMRKDSATFWRDFNAAAERAGRPGLPLNNRHLPLDGAAAYNRLFDYEVANLLFAPPPNKPLAPHGMGFLAQNAQARQTHAQAARAERAPVGQGFVRGFLRYLLAPGVEHGHGLTGFNTPNRAHTQLGQLLAAQQAGRLWHLLPWCRTVLTTNFDSLLQSALALERIIPLVSDRPERGFDLALFETANDAVHIVHLHGSVLRDNPASTSDELGELARANAGVLADHLARHHVLVVGHSGWNDAFVQALALRPSACTLYWCDMAAEPSARIASVLASRQGTAVYVQLDRSGADGLMTDLNAAMHHAQGEAPRSARPR